MPRTLPLTLALLVLAAPALAQTGVDTRTLRRTPVVDVFEAQRDAVVNISSTQVVRVQSPFGVDSLFDQLFDLPNAGRQRQIKRTSVGSGWVLHDSGYIVTNAHVVARTAERKVIFADGKEFDAQVVALDPQRDLAVLKIEPGEHRINALALGRSDDLMVGETVIAIGNPLGYQHTVTSGIVSATDRQLEVGDGVTFEGLIQTDASINPGNSGGPLLNVLGELIGINTAIRADAQNIGFAIPVDQLRQLLPEMLDVERRYRIVTGLRVTADGRPRIVSLQENSPATAAGLELGDVVTQVGEQPVRNAIDYSIAMIGRTPGRPLAITVQRGGQAVRTSLTPVERPRPDGAAILTQRFGITAGPVTDRAARSIGLPGLQGLFVTRVENNSPASRIRLQPGDVIVQIGRHQPTSLDDVGELLENVVPGHNVPITVIRIANRTVYRSTVLIAAR